MSQAVARVLLVDDDAMVLESLALLLDRRWAVVTARSVADARAVLERDEVAVIVADERMPEQPGTELFEWAAVYRPDAVRILLTGFADQDTLIKAINDGKIWHFIRKPWQNEDVVALVQRAVEFRETVAARERADRRYRALFHNVPAGIVLATPDGRVVEANAAFAASLGGSDPAALVGTDLRALGFDGGAWDALVARLRDEGRALQQEVVVRPHGERGGRRAHLLVSAALRATDDDGDLVEATALDVTGLREAEAGERELRELLLRIQKLEVVSAMGSGLVHDLNNTLAVLVHTGAYLQRHATGGPDVGECLADLASATEKARDLTTELMRFLRGTSGEAQPLDCNFPAREVLRLLARVRPDRRIAIAPDLAPALPLVRGHATQIYQCLMNLCLNACDAMAGAGGRLTVRTRVAALPVGAVGELPAGAYVVLEVRDTGRGMTPEVRRRIFEPLFTASGPGGHRGSGLGLAVVDAIVRYHKGHIDVETAPGAGTCFTVYLPALPEAHDGPSASPLPPPHRPRTGHETILLVDDDPVMRARGRAELEPFGYRVLTAADGREAIDVVRQHPDTAVVLLDIVMPGMSGEEAYRAIRQAHPTMRFVLFSGQIVPTPGERGDADDRVRRVSKPDMLAQLPSVVDAMLASFPPEPIGDA